MKNLLLLIIGLVAGVCLYQKIDNDNSADTEMVQNTEIVSVKGIVSNNLSIMGQSVYELTDVSDNTLSYYVMVKGEAPAIGDVREVRLAKYDLLNVNDNRVTVYLEQPKKSWVP